MQQISNTIGYYGSISIVVSMLLLPIIWLTTTKYFDKKPKFKRIYNPLSHISLLFAATIQYALLITFKGGSKKSIYKKMYKNIDFREEARTTDKILSYTFCALGIGGLSLVLVAMILNFIKDYF